MGSRFLAGLVPEIPQWVSILFLSAVGLIYTFRGGFRAVIKTDQLQIKFIWAFIAVLGGYYIYYMITNGVKSSLDKIPTGAISLDFRPGLEYFLIGIAVMNIPVYISNMSVWQRISGAQDPQIVERGLKRSVWSVGISWSLLAVIACLAYMIVIPTSSQTLLTELLVTISQSAIGKVVLFITVIGLYGAMLSTASTNLIAIGHTISEDIAAKMRKGELLERINSKKEFFISRAILFGSTVLAVFLVEGLKWFGFSIADLVFAIYGGALALFPPILAALYSDRNRLRRMSGYAYWAVILGFISGWGAAIFGKIIKDGNLIFLSPGFSILIASVIISIGLLVNNKK